MNKNTNYELEHLEQSFTPIITFMIIIVVAISNNNNPKCVHTSSKKLFELCLHFLNGPPRWRF